MHNLRLADREYTRSAGENIDGFFFSIVSLMPISVEYAYDAYWHSSLAYGHTKGERHATKEWDVAALEIAEDELKTSLLGVGLGKTDRLVRNEWQVELRRELSAAERKLIAQPPDEQRYKFYFSRQQKLEHEQQHKKAKVVRINRSPQVLALLDSGKIAEFTEPIFLEPFVEQSWKCTTDHWERYDDSLEVGDGVMVAVEQFFDENETGLKLTRLLDIAR